MNKNKNHEVSGNNKIWLNVDTEWKWKEEKEFHPCFCGKVLNTNLSGKDKFGSLIKFLPKMYMLIERIPEQRK